MTFIMQLDANTFIDLVNKARTEEHRDKVYQQWLVEMQYNQEIKPFEEYYKTLTSPQKATRSEEEVMQDAENILKSMSR